MNRARIAIDLLLRDQEFRSLIWEIVISISDFLILVVSVIVMITAAVAYKTGTLGGFDTLEVIMVAIILGEVTGAKVNRRLKEHDEVKEITHGT